MATNLLNRHLKTFVLLADLGSFSRAAETLGLSQSAVSQQIAALERELQVELFRRHNRTFSLTEAGRFFLDGARPIVSATDQLVSATRARSCSDEQRIRLGVARTFPMARLAPFLYDFEALHPEWRIPVVLGSHETLQRQLRDGELDLVLNAQRRAFSAQYHNTDLIVAEVYVELNAQHPLATQSLEVSADALRDFPCYIVATPDESAAESAYTAEILGIESEIITFESRTLLECRLEQSMGYSLSDRLADELGASDNVLAPLLVAGERVRKRYCLFSKKKTETAQTAELRTYLAEAFSSLKREQNTDTPAADRLKPTFTPNF